MDGGLLCHSLKEVLGALGRRFLLCRNQDGVSLQSPALVASWSLAALALVRETPAPWCPSVPRTSNLHPKNLLRLFLKAALKV